MKIGPAKLALLFIPFAIAIPTCADDAVAPADAGGGETCDAVVEWTDPDTGLMWEQTACGTFREWSAAQTYCDELTTTSSENWRLPTISELRALIRGCDSTETGGACAVDDDCLDPGCYSADACQTCVGQSGPASGCFWPSELAGVCEGYWSSSARSDSPTMKWIVMFHHGALLSRGQADDYPVRCVTD